jgi:hypothetical protein
LWAAEPLEGVLQKGGWKSATLVLDVELDGSVDIARAQAHAPVAVAERIVDKVAESLFEAKAVAVEGHSGRSIVGERPRALIRTPLEPAYHGRKELVGVERLQAQRQLPSIGASDE